MIEATCPGSCGEIIQGYIKGSLKLISLPINCYTRVRLIEGKSGNNNYPKVQKMIEKIFKYYGYDKKDTENISIKICSDIPIGKGMASSTADLAATAVVCSKYLGKKITEVEVASLCTEVEPTDSTVFSDFTLFDYINGDYIKHYDGLSQFRILTLEGKDIIDTVEFNKRNNIKTHFENRDNIKKALNYFEEGISKKDLSFIGKCGIISASQNQKILPIKDLYEIINLSLKYGGYGINIAHSGTVIGILYNEDRFNKDKFIYNIKSKKLIENYLNIRDFKVVNGGAKLL